MLIWDRHHDWDEYYDAINETYDSVCFDITEKKYLDDTECAYLEKVRPILETLEEIMREASVYTYNQYREWLEANKK